MLNDSLGSEIPGEFSVAQTVNKLVFGRTKPQTISCKKYKRTVIKQAVAPATFGPV